MRAVCLCLTLLLAAPAAAQNLHCAPRAQVLDMLSKQEQTRRAMGQAGPAMMEMFAAKASQRWTLTVTFRDGRMCLIAHGTGFEAQNAVFPAPGTAS